MDESPEGWAMSKNGTDLAVPILHGAKRNTHVDRGTEQAKEKSKELEAIKGKTETLMSAVEELEANDSLSKKEVEQVYIKRREKQDKELASIQAELDESLKRAKELEAKVANKPSE